MSTMVCLLYGLLYKPVCIISWVPRLSRDFFLDYVRQASTPAEEPDMAIERIEIDLLRLPYVHFFETSFGRSYDRTFSLVRVFEGGLCGWGEGVAEEAPLYSGETAESAWHVMKEFLIPLVLRKDLV